MALQLPNAPQIFESDPFGAFKDAYSWGKGVNNENLAKKALGSYVESLYANGATTPQPQNVQAAQQQPLGGITRGLMGLTQPQTATAATTQVAAPFDGNNFGVPDDALYAYQKNARAAESGGNDQAANPNSSAQGRYQFLESTWNGLAQKHPELQLTADGRNDPAQQERAMAVFTKENAQQLSSAGIPVNPGTLYAAHFLGAGGAQQVLSAPDQTPVSNIVSADVVQANPFLAGMTVGDFKNWAGSKGGGGNAGGYQAPQAGNIAPAAQLPPKEVLLALAQSPETRPLLNDIIKTVQAGNDPAHLLALATQQQALNNQGVPNGYRRTATGDLEPTPGGPFDPANPLNASKTNTVSTLTADEVSQLGLPAGSYQRDSDGKITQIGGSKTPDKPASIQEYDLYVEQEKAAGRTPVSFGEWKKANAGGLSVQTNPDGTVNVTQGAQMPKLTEGQSKDVGYLTRGTGANATLDQLDTKLTSFGEKAAGALPFGLGAYVQSDDYQLAKNAGLEFLAALLRKDSGGAITPEETDTYGAIYLPQPGEPTALIQQKKDARARALKAIELGLPAQAIATLESEGLLQKALDATSPAAAPPAAAGGVPDGVDPALWAVMTPEEQALWQ